MDLTDAGVVIVGASGDFGSALARAFVDRGARLVVSGRNADRLAEVAAATGAHPHIADLTEPGAPEALLEAAHSHLGAVDVVVCSAGVVAFGPAADLDDRVLAELFAVNALLPMRLSRAALAHLGKGAVIVNVSGIVAEQPTSGMAAYSASKAALTAFDVATKREARRVGVRVLDVRPPHMETGLATRPLAGAPPKLPTGRDPREIARLVVVAIADEANEVAISPR